MAIRLLNLKSLKALALALALLGPLIACGVCFIGAFISYTILEKALVADPQGFVFTVVVACTFGVFTLLFSFFIDGKQLGRTGNVS